MFESATDAHSASTNNIPLRLIGYGRASTAKQSITKDVQLEGITRYCELYGHHLVDFFYDAAKSGKSKQNRGELLKALELLEAGKANGIIIYKLDRLTRSPKDLFELVENYFKTYTLISVCDQIDTHSANGRLVINILMAVANWEREIIVERTLDALETKKAKGQHIGRVGIGYTKTKAGKLEKTPLYDILVDVYRRWNNGSTLQELATELNQKGIQTATKKPWHPQNLWFVLKKIENELMSLGLVG
ncbi:recombinase family protein [Fischerella sp. PCC 9605]|uniref:recombinase family protein n=1 Tax=Fischerella sp. PCC 9605 TaxID=1173024 RepID=UPI0004BB724D|nr:recombinase family protein [Fischerella sp. PCC 9605]